MPRRRLLRVLLIIALALAAIIVIAVVVLFLYEPSPTAGLAFSSAGKTMQRGRYTD